MPLPNLGPPTPAKVCRPRGGRPILRPRLFERIDGLRDARVIWVAGPPGSGKTTLAASYLAERGVGGLWLQLDEDDADPANFFHYLGLALAHAIGANGARLPAWQPQFMATRLRYTCRCADLLAASTAAHSVIVFDDCERLAADAPAHEIMAELAAALPAGLSLMVLSRSDPPAAFARLRLHEELAVIGGTELNLTPTEGAALVASRSADQTLAIGPEHVGRLLVETEGWFAGFTLLLAENNAPDVPAARDKSRRLLFDYFATELIDRLDAPMQEALTRTALLPRMTAADAEKASGHPTVGRLLAYLHRTNCFVTQRGEATALGAVYEYHALFRAFLLSRSAAFMTDTGWRAQQALSANILSQSGQTDAAAALYREAGEWSALMALALREAPALIAAGRHRHLEDWLAAVPEQLLRASAWLSHWRGVARLPFDAIAARGLFEQAYACFEREQDAVGLYLTWAGAMESFFYEWRDFRLADPWIEEFERLRARHPVFPSRAVELRTYWAMGTLLHRQPQHPLLPDWARRAQLLLDPGDSDLSVLIGGYLIIWFLWRGETTSARSVVERITPWIKPELPAMVRILWCCAIGFFHSVRGETDACGAAIQAGLELARQSDLHGFDFLLAAQMARCSLVAGDPDGADTWMASMAGTMRSHSHLDGAFYQYLRCSAAVQRGHWQLAIDHGRRALALAVESGVPILIATSHIALARSLRGHDGTAEWAEHVQAAREVGQTMQCRVPEYLCLEVEASVALACGGGVQADALLQRAMALSHTMDGATWSVASLQANAPLYDQALAAGIETGHVQHLIRRHRLVPPEPATAAESWPWPIRLYTLGRFEILCDEQPLQWTGKAQRKPLELLKCLCAFGGQTVNQDRITDALWPAAEGDAADQALRTTLHRLRKLLRHEQAVRLEGRHLHLDPQWLWADCLVFDRAAHHPRLTDEACLRAALSRYRGPFLDGESASWALGFRGRLHAHFLRMAERLGTLLEERGDWRAALQCYAGAIEIEPLAEGLHRRLMTAHARLGQGAEALAAYERCRQLLLMLQGVRPAPETEALFQQLMLR